MTGSILWSLNHQAQPQVLICRRIYGSWSYSLTLMCVVCIVYGYYIFDSVITQHRLYAAAGQSISHLLLRSNQTSRLWIFLATYARVSTPWISKYKWSSHPLTLAALPLISKFCSSSFFQADQFLKENHVVKSAADAGISTSAPHIIPSFPCKWTYELGRNRYMNPAERTKLVPLLISSMHMNMWIWLLTCHRIGLCFFMV